jgi:hypothetical protein
MRATSLIGANAMKALIDALLLNLEQLHERFEQFEGEFDEVSARIDCHAAIETACAIQATQMLADLCERHRAPSPH